MIIFFPSSWVFLQSHFSRAFFWTHFFFLLFGWCFLQSHFSRPFYWSHIFPSFLVFLHLLSQGLSFDSNFFPFVLGVFCGSHFSTALVIPNFSFFLGGFAFSFCKGLSFCIIFPPFKKTRGVSQGGLAVYIKKYIKAKEEFWKSSKRNQNPSRWS